MGSADHRFNLADILSQNYGIQEEEEEEETDIKEETFLELGKSFYNPQIHKESEVPFEELLSLYGYKASCPTLEQDLESDGIPANLTDMTLDKQTARIAQEFFSSEEEERQCPTDEQSPLLTSHDASDIFLNRISSNYLVDEDKELYSSSSDVSSASEESKEGSLPLNECKQEIMVGPLYQASVPLLYLEASLPLLYFDKHSEKVYENEDQLLWDPNILPEREVEEFLYKAAKQRWDEISRESLPKGDRVKDSEQALYELVKCSFNTEEALRRLRFNVKVIRDELCAWSEEECRNFEHGFRVHGKNFHLIQANKVRTRSVGECVEYYYMWKKSERYDYFTQQTRFGRRKYSLHPGTMDYVDNDLDGGRMESANCPHSSPPVPSFTSCLDSQFNQDLVIESTESLSAESTAYSVGSLSECGQGYEYSTPSEINCPFDPGEEPSGMTTDCTRSPVNPSETGFYQLPAGLVLADQQDPLPSSDGYLSMGFALPGGMNGGLPLISSSMDFERDPTQMSPAQLSLSITDFGIVGVQDVNSFLVARTPCPAPVIASESLSQ
ncbi:mesoderm induction early response protein 2 isoform X2 [Microcaecilia unicolor]|uniref:Mesoderm induction early response protein 2 isoform X2 n=1 Tax=Microcaecilia unicolor TaxID=1415580 RepID=A0A6P7ZG26_9AMPH|nr:mesoderm induction early response protein 2 isoform X2 [Microcaecilia unicolor]